MNTNEWTINEEVVREFENFAPLFESAQPPIAMESKVSLTEISPWTNRVPMHEPWPRVMKIDQGDVEDDKQNEENDGYKNNVDWIDQYTNDGEKRNTEPIGRIEGDDVNDRGPFWRR